MWTKYFKFVKLRRGRVITPSHGEIDFSRDDLPVETCRQLFESDFPYLEITEEGKKELYGIVTVAEPVEAPTSPASRSVGDAPIIEAEAEAEGQPFIDLAETVETEVSPPNRKKYVKMKSSE